MLKEFQNILVTGGCGFIGSNFLNYMIAKYPNVTFHNIDALNYCADQQNVIHIDADNYRFLHARLQEWYRKKWGKQ